jgi:hypothetical protein
MIINMSVSSGCKGAPIISLIGFLASMALCNHGKAEIGPSSLVV